MRAGNSPHPRRGKLVPPCGPAQQEPGYCTSLDQTAASTETQLRALWTQHHWSSTFGTWRRAGVRGDHTLGPPPPKEKGVLFFPSPPRAQAWPHYPSHLALRSKAAEGVKKEMEAAAAEPWEPFYCTAGQGTPPTRGAELQECGTGLTPTVGSSTGRRDRAFEAGGAPPLPIPTQPDPAP